MAAVFNYLKEEKRPTAKRAHQIIDEVLEKYGCASPHGHIVAGGRESAEPHAIGSGRLRRRQPIVIDIYPRSLKTGYFADITRTVCLGQPSAKLKKMYDTVLRAQKLAINLVKPGAKCADLQAAVQTFFRASGYKTSGKGKEFLYANGFVHGLGHGIGKNIHETPSLGRKTKDILRVGDVITIEPGRPILPRRRRNPHRGYVFSNKNRLSAFE